MPNYTEFFLNSPSSIIQFETIEISHPDFSKVYRLVRNDSLGLTATLEDDTEVDFDYLPMQITNNTSSNDLDYGINVQLGDVGEIIAEEVAAITPANQDVKPVLKYRTFRSDDLSEPMVGPIILQVSELSFNKQGVLFGAIAPRLNLNKTGRTYKLLDFPTLESFV